MKYFLLIVGLLWGPDLAAQPLTVLTYNIRYDNPGDGENTWSKRRDFLAAQIRFHTPDVFGIQEGLQHQVAFLSEALPLYKAIGVGRDDGRTTGEYSALFYRTDRFNVEHSGTFWLSETPDTPSVGWDAALPRICTYALLTDTSGQQVWIFNTHFDHVGKLAREKSAKLILHKIRMLNTTLVPVVLMGDFNCEPSESPYRLLDEQLSDTRKHSVDHPFGPEGTFNSFEFHQPVNRRIDYIFVNTGFTVQQYAVLSDNIECRYPSDHLPVLARLNWKIQ